MECSSPRNAWQNLRTGELVFSQNSTLELGPTMSRPCGQCMPCRINYASEQALRCEHEAAMHEENSFLTLTVDDAHFPRSQAEWEETFRKGLDRIRKAKAPQRFRTFGCLELGENTQRPHGHLLAMGATWEKSRPVARAKGKDGGLVYESDELSAAWKVGRVTIGDFTPQSAGYVARYALARRTNVDGVPETVAVVHPLTGELVHLRPAMSWARSRRPGIGAEWFRQFGAQQVEQGCVILRGGERRPLPTYYRRLGKRIDPLLGSQARAEAQLHAFQNRDNSTPERLAVRLEVLESRIGSALKRETI